MIIEKKEIVFCCKLEKENEIVCIFESVKNQEHIKVSLTKDREKNLFIGKKYFLQILSDDESTL